MRKPSKGKGAKPTAKPRGRPRKVGVTSRKPKLPRTKAEFDAWSDPLGDLDIVLSDDAGEWAPADDVSYVESVIALEMSPEVTAAQLRREHELLGRIIGPKNGKKGKTPRSKSAIPGTLESVARYGGRAEAAARRLGIEVGPIRVKRR